MIYRCVFYVLGLLILALGITLNTKTDLGVSPIISVAYSISSIWGLNFGNVALGMYVVFVLIEMFVHVLRFFRLRVGSLAPFPLRAVLLKDFLQIPLSWFFTRFLNLFALLFPQMTGSSAQELAWRYFVLILAIILTGIGAAMSLNMRLIPNSGDGVVQALADLFGTSVGLMKNIFDVCCISSTLAISFFFTGKLVGMGVGTVLAVIGVGRAIAAFNYFCGEKLVRMAGGNLHS